MIVSCIKNISLSIKFWRQNLMDNALDKDPNILIVCGDDLNQLDLTLLQRLTGLSVLVDFPTKDDAFLDNCLTNKPELSN